MDDEHSEGSRVLQGLHVRGELGHVMDVVRAVYQQTKRALDTALLKKVLVNAEDWAKFQHQQGQCAGVLAVLRALESAAQLETTKQPSRRPDMA